MRRVRRRSELIWTPWTGQVQFWRETEEHLPEIGEVREGNWARRSKGKERGEREEQISPQKSIERERGALSFQAAASLLLCRICTTTLLCQPVSSTNLLLSGQASPPLVQPSPSRAQVSQWLQMQKLWSTFEFIHTKKRNRLQHRILNDNVFVSYNRKNMSRFQKRREKVGDKSYDPLVIEDFDWGNEWVDPTMPPPQGARGCPDDISWELVDEAVGASSSLQGRNFPRTTTQRGPSSVHIPYQRQRKRLAPTPPLFEQYYQEEDEEQHSSIPNGEDDDSDFVNDDDDVNDDDEDATSADQDGGDNTNATTIDEFDDGY